MKIYVRDDDVFRLGGGYTSYCQVVERVKKVHEVIVNEGAAHVVALICGTLNWFPRGLEFLVDAYKRKELIPEIHGWDHINYGNLPKEEIIYHLEHCIEVIWDNFKYWPTKFYTPYGANTPNIKEAAECLKLKAVDCSNILYPKRKVFGSKMWKSYSDIIKSGESELLIHWWENKWFEESKSNTHSLIKTLRVIKNNDRSYWTTI